MIPPSSLGLTQGSKLIEVLERSKQLGFFGPADIADQAEHALRYLESLLGFTESVVDLGAGGGLPSLPLLVESEELNINMVDTSERRCSFLSWAIVELGVVDRASVSLSRAEEFAHQVDHREQHSAVIARGFGPPAITLECAAPLVKVGGRVIISEPPQSRDWPADALESLGLELVSSEKMAVFSKVAQSQDMHPRKFRAMQKKPLF